MVSIDGLSPGIPGPVRLSTTNRSDHAPCFRSCRGSSSTPCHIVSCDVFFATSLSHRRAVHVTYFLTTATTCSVTCLTNPCVLHHFCAFPAGKFQDQAGNNAFICSPYACMHGGCFSSYPPPCQASNCSTCLASFVQMEEERRKHEPPTETERLHAAANSHTRNRADDLLTEQRDEVKHMNQMVQYSKCVTIR